MRGCPRRGLPPGDAAPSGACLLAWPGDDRSGGGRRRPGRPRRWPWQAPRAQRRAFLEVCEARLDLGLDVDEPAHHPAERLALPPACQAAYFEGAPCPCTCTFRPYPGVVNRERDQLGGDRLPAEVRPLPPASLAPWAEAGPLPPSSVPFHRWPEVLDRPNACRACGARAVEAYPGRRAAGCFVLSRARRGQRRC